MNALVDFVINNAALLAALIALAISLRANHTAQQAHSLNIQIKRDSDRAIVYEKKREILNEVDLQHARVSSLLMVVAQKIILISEHPELQKAMPKEIDRLRSNLPIAESLRDEYEMKRGEVEKLNEYADIGMQEEVLAEIKRLTIRIEKDLAHEQAHLAELRSRVNGTGRA